MIWFCYQVCKENFFEIKKLNGELNNLMRNIKFKVIEEFDVLVYKVLLIIVNVKGVKRVEI